MTHRFRFTCTRLLPACALAALLVGPPGFAPSANAADVTYPGSNLDKGPLWNIDNSLFPAGSLSDNVVTINSGNVGGDVYGNDVDAAFSPVSNNTVILSGGSVGGDILGGANNGAVTDNNVSISGFGSVLGSVYGGYGAAEGTVNGNDVSIFDSGSVTGNVLGGYSRSVNSHVIGNTVTISGGTVRDIYGGQSGKGNALNNSVTLDGAASQANVIYGGRVEQGTARENAVVMKNGSVALGIFGGIATVDGGQAQDNHVTMSGGSVGQHLIGGYVQSGSGEASGNSVIFNGGSVTGNVYGGQSAAGLAQNNSVTMTNGSANWLLGGYSNSGDASGNRVEVSGGTLSGGVNGGETTSGNATGNSVDFSNVTATYVQGGYSGSGSATGNSLAIRSGTVQNNAFGGYVDSGSGEASGNSVTFNGGSVANNIYGGMSAAGLVQSNNVIMTNGSAKWLLGGYSNSGDVSGNSVNVSGGTLTGVSGGESNSGSATGNIVSISGGTVHGNVNGGFVASDNGKATGNIVNISGKADLSGAVVAGGSSPDGDAFTDNTLNKNSDAAVHIARNFASVNFGYSGTANIGELDSTPTGSALSGVTVNTNANNVSFDGVISGSGSITKTGAGTLILSGTNTYSGGTTISAGTLKGNIASGTDLSIAASATYDGDNKARSVGDLNGGGNIFNTDGLTVQSGTFGGVIDNSNTSLTKTGAGTLTLSGTNTYTGMTTVRSGTLALGSDLTSNQLTLYGGTVFDRGSHNHSLDNGILSVNGANGQSAMYKGDLSARNATLNFISPVHPTQPLLRVTGDADVSGSACNVGLAGGTSLASGSTLTLLEVDPDKTLTANNLQRGNGIVQIGSTVAHDITADVNLDPTTRRLNAVTAQVSPGRATDQSKALSEGFLGGLALNLQGADLVAGRGMDSAVRASSGTDDAERHGFAGFGALSGGSLRYNTGSHLDMNSLSLLTGLAWGIDLAPGRLTLGAFFEYGNGSYDTHNSFTNAASVDGDGNAYYLGGGILARMDFVNTGPGRFYAEASGRAGKTHNEYDSSDLRDAAGRKADYDSSSPYYGLHFGTGYVWNINDAATLDLYGKYFWTRQQGDSVGLSTGEHLSFDDINSSRLRFGGRFAYILNEHVAPYIGAAWEHEFDGKARARTNGFDIDAPNLRGNTGIGELGLSLTPSTDLPLTVDLGVQGYTGKHEGVTGSLMVKWEF
ncbi:autotransporter-associated beta strand repeat-containing protein [Bilophila wadsworthia]